MPTAVIIISQRGSHVTRHLDARIVLFGALANSKAQMPKLHFGNIKHKNDSSEIYKKSISIVLKCKIF